MSWPEEHKQKTRDRIVDVAAAAFREHGAAGVGVADIMKRAGLTHGGFYAHFKSKDELLAAAVAHASEQVSSVFGSASGERSTGGLFEIAATYLSPAHMAHPEHGCPVAALGTELVRGSQKVRGIVDKELQRRLKLLYVRTPARLSPARRRRQAAGALAIMVGGMILARSLKGEEGLEFLADCQGFLRDAVSGTGRPESSD